MTNRISFTAFITKIIKNTSINYKKKKNYILKKEMYFSNELEIEGTIKIEENQLEESIEKINYLKLEEVFTKKEYYKAMKSLADKEKLVLYLSIIKKIPLKKIANLLKTNENNISKIKYRAKNKFLKNLEMAGDSNFE